MPRHRESRAQWYLLRMLKRGPCPLPQGSGRRGSGGRHVTICGNWVLRRTSQTLRPILHVRLPCRHRLGPWPHVQPGSGFEFACQPTSRHTCTCHPAGSRSLHRSAGIMPPVNGTRRPNHGRILCWPSPADLARDLPVALLNFESNGRDHHVVYRRELLRWRAQRL